MPISADIKKTFSAARMLGNGDDRVTLSENEVYSLLAQCWSDLKTPQEIHRLPIPAVIPPSSDYFRVPLVWFQNLQPNCPTATTLVSSLASCVEHNPDFRLYFLNLATLHKRRIKYQRILSAQPRPTMNQVGPRSLLEFGGINDELLASWLLWRKWIFDLDNRAAQETGYLFEPILASCLGGEAVGSRNSPVKRVVNGIQTDEGRQIDCYDGESQLAYEFKLRVTIAASGQGRFAEELSFPAECRAAELRPVLIVLDPTPSPRLTELIQAFTNNNGLHYIGANAWEHMEQKAGDTMAVYLEKYIKPPLTEMAKYEEKLPQPIQLTWTATHITIKGQEASLQIVRRQPSA